MQEERELNVPQEPSYGPTNEQYQVNVLYTMGTQKYEPINDLSKTALHTAAWTSIRGPGEIKVEYLYHLDVSLIKSKYAATRITVKSASLQCSNAWGGDPHATTNIKALIDGSPLPTQNLNPGWYPTYQKNIIPIVDQDLTNTASLDIIVYLDLWSGNFGWIDWYFGALQIVLSVETPLQFYPVYVLCTIPDTSPEGIRVAIKDLIEYTDYTGSTKAFSLVAGSYTAYANATVGNSTYKGSVSFNVPITEMPTIALQREGEFALPWWWYIPVIAISGVVLTYVLWPKPRRREYQPQVVVVR